MQQQPLQQIRPEFPAPLRQWQQGKSSGAPATVQQRRLPWLHGGGNSATATASVHLSTPLATVQQRRTSSPHGGDVAIGWGGGPWNSCGGGGDGWGGGAQSNSNHCNRSSRSTLAPVRQWQQGNSSRAPATVQQRRSPWLHGGDSSATATASVRLSTPLATVQQRRTPSPHGGDAAIGWGGGPWHPRGGGGDGWGGGTQSNSSHYNRSGRSTPAPLRQCQQGNSSRAPATVQQQRSPSPHDGSNSAIPTDPVHVGTSLALSSPH